MLTQPEWRGDVDDYDTWGALGNPGWSWQSMLPYFKKVTHTFFITTALLPRVTIGTSTTS
jgi:choline dehydrogenase-like flavoprotein